MKKFIIAAIISLGLLGTAQASQTAKFVCFRTPTTPTNGVVVKLQVNTNFDDPNAVFEAIQLIHVVDGVPYDRMAQYKVMNLLHVKGHYEFIWIGYQINDPNIIMGGRVWHNDEQGWLYSEIQQFQDGRPSHTVVKALPCIPVNDK